METQFPDIRLPLEICLIIAEHLRPRDRVQLLRAIPGLQNVLTSKHIFSPGRSDKSVFNILVEQGDATLLQSLLDTTGHGPNHYTANWHGATALGLACRKGHAPVVQVLLGQKWVNPNSKYMVGGTTPLIWAARRGDEEMVRVLLDGERVDINLRDDAWHTPLLTACQWGNVAVAQLLLAQDGVRADSEDRNGATPLSYAARKGHLALVECLAQRDDVDLASADRDSRTAFFWAVESGRRDVVAFLLGLRYPPSRDQSEDFSEDPSDSQDTIGLDWEDTDGRAPLLVAIQNGDATMVELLLRHRDLIAVDRGYRDGRTALSWACQMGSLAMVKSLLSCDGVCADSKDINGSTPLAWAVKAEYKEIVRLLAEREDVDINSQAQGNMGLTPLAVAVQAGFIDIAELLLDHGALVNSRDNSHRTPLMLAALAGYEKMVGMLIQRSGIEVNAKDESGRTALSYATENGEEELVRMLLDHNGLDVDSRDYEGIHVPLTSSATES